LLFCHGIVVDSQATTFACNSPKLCKFPFSWQPLLSSTMYSACTSDGISGKLNYYWCSKKDKYNTGDDYVVCTCDNVLASPDTLALSLCTGWQSGPLGQVPGSWTSAGVLSQDCASSPCSSIRSTWSGTYSVCKTVKCHGGANFQAQNNSLTVCSLASALSCRAALLVAFSASVVSLLGSWRR
jgi:hypothetical protein